MTRIVRCFFLPPGLFLELVLVAAWLYRRRPRWGQAMLIALGALMGVLSLPITANALLNTLDRYPHLTESQAQNCGAQAIVCLGAGANSYQAELGGPGLSDMGLERTYYAVHLQKKTHLPILFTGTGPNGDPIAAWMRDTAQSMGAPSELLWAETQALDTRENATLSAQFLAEKGCHKVLVVTNHWHMPRAMSSFRKTSLEPVAAPFRSQRLDPEDVKWLPTSWGLYASSRCLEEYLGMAFYIIRG